MLQSAVQGSPHPVSYPDGCGWPYPPGPVNLVLQDVSRRTLIAFREGGDHRVLFLPQPQVSDLHVISGLVLAHTDITHVDVALFAQVGQHGSVCCQRVVLGVQIVFILKD